MASFFSVVISACSFPGVVKRADSGFGDGEVYGVVNSFTAICYTGYWTGLDYPDYALYFYTFRLGLDGLSKAATTAGSVAFFTGTSFFALSGEFFRFGFGVSFVI